MSPIGTTSGGEILILCRSSRKDRVSMHPGCPQRAPATPRRLAVWVKDVAERQEDLAEELHAADGIERAGSVRRERRWCAPTCSPGRLSAQSSGSAHPFVEPNSFGSGCHVFPEATCSEATRHHCGAD